MQFGFNPFLCPPVIFYGLFGGLFRWYLAKKFSVVRIGISYLFPVVLGSILYQSFALAYFYFSGGTYTEGILYYLGTRTFQFSITNLNLTISSSIISEKQTICFDRRMNTLDKVTLK